MHIKSCACGLGLSLIIVSVVVIIIVFFFQQHMTVLELADFLDHPTEECRKQTKEGKCCFAKL